MKDILMQAQASRDREGLKPHNSIIAVNGLLPSSFNFPKGEWEELYSALATDEAEEMQKTDGR